MPTPEQIAAFLADPQNFLHGLNIQDGQFQFVRVSRQTLSNLPFLDTRTLGTAEKKTTLSAAEVFQSLEEQNFRQTSQKSNFLFHTSFCCSTMIARCLDAPGRNLSLKESYALLGLSSFRRLSPNFNPGGAEWQNLRDLTLFLLSRRFALGEQILFKPSNGANNILPEILDYPGTKRVVLLYSSLERFLVSIITSGKDREEYSKGILKIFLSDFGADLELHSSDEFSPLQIGALIWGLQMRAFDKVADSGHREMLRTLDCDVFLQDPRGILSRLNKFYGLGFTSANLDDISRGPAMKMHSKETGRTFSSEDRAKEKETVLAEHGTAIKDAVTWCRALGFEFSKGLPNPL